jgi:hypothetical protein
MNKIQNVTALIDFQHRFMMSHVSAKDDVVFADTADILSNLNKCICVYTLNTTQITTSHGPGRRNMIHIMNATIKCALPAEL